MRKRFCKSGWCWLALVLLLLLPTGCDDVNAEEAAATASPTAAPVVIVVPTVTPTAAPTVVAPAAVTATATIARTPAPTAVLTVTPTVAAAVQAVQPTVAPTPARVALVRYRDNQYTRSGDFTILSTNLPPAPAGHHYDLWLTKNGQPTFRLGSLPNQTPLNFTGSADQHLLAIYEGALLSLEPDADTPGEMGPLLYQGITPPEALIHIRQIADRYVGNPNEQGFLIGAQNQWQLARDHADLLRQALAANNLTEGRRHAEHVINIINGEAGDPYGDLDGDGVAQNPGDGVGVTDYLHGAQAETKLAAGATDATDEIKLHAGHVLVSSDNVLDWLSDVNAEAVRVLSADTVEEAQPTAERVAALLDQANAGLDPDGDGVVMPIAGQGGLLTAYEHTLNMGGIELYSVNDRGAAPPVAAEPPTPAATESHDHSAPQVEPTPAPVVVEIVDFAFNAPTVTVPTGATVTWVNRGNAKHSATADDGSFDTGLLDPGASGSVTFTQPGSYPYSCVLHGGSGGVGMAGTVIVEAP
ncbi:MAG: hypothetical protein DYG89_52950 [Caldilinea sp. CFX5]|nr:hypothetical protein [Caldilinea sp. CFX5]